MTAAGGFENGEKRNRDESGRFLPGHATPGPGRPPGHVGPDFRRLVIERCEREGVTVEDAVWAVFTALLKKARRGDVAAARVLLDRLCPRDETIHITDHRPQMSDLERAVRVEQLLAIAAQRKREAEERGSSGDDDSAE